MARTRHAGTPPLLAAFLVACATLPAVAQKVDLQKCEVTKGAPLVTTFSIDLPFPPRRAQNRVVRAFMAVGLAPSAANTLANQIEWDSGQETNAWTGDTRRRRIVATIMEGDDSLTSTVMIAAQESNTNAWDQSSAKPLSNRAGGYGLKVWCAASSVRDSLASLAERLAGASAKRDSAPEPKPR